MELFTFKTNPLYIPADLDSDDENFKDYAESKNKGDQDNDDMDIRKMNQFIDKRFKYTGAQPRAVKKPITGEQAAIIDQEEEAQREQDMKYYSSMTSNLSATNTTLMEQSMLSNMNLDETQNSQRESDAFTRSLSLKLAKGQKKGDGT